VLTERSGPLNRWGAAFIEPPEWNASLPGMALEAIYRRRP
jgi:hypothetical protein